MGGMPPRERGELGKGNILTFLTTKSLAVKVPSTAFYVGGKSRRRKKEASLANHFTELADFTTAELKLDLERALKGRGLDELAERGLVLGDIVVLFGTWTNTNEGRPFGGGAGAFGEDVYEETVPVPCPDCPLHCVIGLIAVSAG